MVEELRAAWLELINQSPCKITHYTRTMVENAFGKLVPLEDSGIQPAYELTPLEYEGETVVVYGEEVGVAYRARISHERASVQRNTEVPSGKSTDLSLYLIATYNVPLVEGDTILEGTNYYTVGPINEMKIGVSVYGKEAPLTRVER